jgi:methionyl-tRNA formyltransferase
MGTPDLAASVLRQVAAWPGGRIVAVYSQPDRPAGRGLELKAPPVKTLALEQGIPVFQPPHFKADADVDALRALLPDYLLVAAYGLILPQRVLDIPRCLALNVHPSLLPRHRGAAPIQRAVMNGDAETGVSIMAMDAGLDTGPVLLRRSVPIGPRDTAGSMGDTLAELGGRLLVEALAGLAAGRLTAVPQDERGASRAAKLEKADGAVDFARPARVIDARIRGLTPWPGAFAFLERDGEKPVRVGLADGAPLPEAAKAVDGPAARETDGPAGETMGLIRGRLAVRCADGVFGLSSLKPAGKAAMDAASFVNGYLRGGKRTRFLPAG